VGENRFDNMCIVGDTQLVRDGQQQRVGLGDGLILLELLDEDVGRGGVAPTKDGWGRIADEANLVGILTAAAREGAIALVHHRQDVAADRDARFACVAGRFPGGAEGSDLGGLLDVEG
jgi:hypothetical protein